MRSTRAAHAACHRMQGEIRHAVWKLHIHNIDNGRASAPLRRICCRAAVTAPSGCFKVTNRLHLHDWMLCRMAQAETGLESGMPCKELAFWPHLLEATYQAACCPNLMCTAPKLVAWKARNNLDSAKECWPERGLVSSLPCMQADSSWHADEALLAADSAHIPSRHPLACQLHITLLAKCALITAYARGRSVKALSAPGRLSPDK